MPRPDCWEAMRCGREPGGARVGELGICPAATETRLDGINHGVNGGRSCWGVPATGCAEILFGGGKFTQCLQCPFFQRVESEEGRYFQVRGPILQRLRGLSTAPEERPSSQGTRAADPFPDSLGRRS